MKKSLLLTLGLTALCALTACNNGQQESSKEEEIDYSTYTGWVEELENDDGDIYTGFLKDGLYDGYGELELMTGTVYRGEFSEGKWNGTCYILWDSGCIYIGEAAESLMHGIGYMLWTMGDYYVGQWANGTPEGWGMKGYMANATGENTQDKYNFYMGEMKNNYKIGFGLMRYFFGDLYYGEWKGDVRSGQGTVLWAGGDTDCYAFTGTFKNDWIDGEGVMTYRNGKIVHGIFDGIECVKEIEVINEGPKVEEITETTDRVAHMATLLPQTTDSSALLDWAHMMIA